MTQSGLRYTDLDPGRDERRQAVSPKEGEEVVVHYRGTLPDGASFVDTEVQGSPYTFVLGGGSEIRGFDEGISTMKVGGLRRLIARPNCHTAMSLRSLSATAFTYAKHNVTF